jgi:hypothetical protein
MRSLLVHVATASGRYEAFIAAATEKLMIHRVEIGSLFTRRSQHDYWPLTANPHLVVHHQTATHTGKVQTDWITTRLGTSAQAIREDRILHEAHATGGDARRLCDLFGISIDGAQCYTATVDHPAIANLADVTQR